MKNAQNQHSKGICAFLYSFLSIFFLLLTGASFSIQNRHFMGIKMFNDSLAVLTDDGTQLCHLLFKIKRFHQGYSYYIMSQ